MISKLQGGAKDAVEAIESSQQYTASTSNKAQEAGQALSEIAVTMDSILEVNTQIAGAIEEQSSVAQEIGTNITNITEMAASAEQIVNETDHSARSLRAVADRLNEQVSSFKI
jgi:methyl-accepting chemotaxis protein